MADGRNLEGTKGSLKVSLKEKRWEQYVISLINGRLVPLKI